jgi:hypothetical protein
MAGEYPKNGPSKTNWEAVRLKTYGNQTSRKTKTTMARRCHEDLKKLKFKNWKEAAKDRRTWRDWAEKAKTHKRVVVTNDNDDDE